MTPTLSRTLWELDWTSLLPHPITEDGIAVQASDYDSAEPFIRDHYATIFEDDPRTAFAAADLHPSKGRYYRAAGDFFAFVQRDRMVGLLIGTPIDWCSYYIRSAAVLPEYQGRSLPQRFFPFLFAHLREAGVTRVEADTSPANVVTMKALTNLSFNVCGTQLSERWGALVHLVKYLDPAPQNVFLDQFCAGVKYQRRERGHATERKESQHEEAIRTQHTLKQGWAASIKERRSR